LTEFCILNKPGFDPTHSSPLDLFAAKPELELTACAKIKIVQTAVATEAATANLNATTILQKALFAMQPLEFREAIQGLDAGGPGSPGF
jgi:hypothetical protein